MTRDPKVLEKQLFAPSLLADAFGSVLAGEDLLADLAPGSPERERVRWRVEELRAKMDPEGVLESLEREPPGPERKLLADRLRAEALLELERTEEAGQVIARHLEESGPAWELLRGRLAFARGKRLLATSILDALMARQDLDAEVKAAALSFRMRYRALVHNPDGAREDLKALRTLLVKHGAVLSDTIVDVVGQYVGFPARQAAIRWKAGEVAQAAAAQIAEGITETQEALGPLPIYVHALFVKLRPHPERLISLAVRLAGAQYVAGQTGAAYLTLYYVDQLAGRLLDEKWAFEAHEAFDEMCKKLGRAEVEFLESDRQARSDAFLQKKERPQA